jgi:hypothetical protein
MGLHRELVICPVPPSHWPVTLGNLEQPISAFSCGARATGFCVWMHGYANFCV